MAAHDRCQVRTRCISHRRGSAMPVVVRAGTGVNSQSRRGCCGGGVLGQEIRLKPHAFVAMPFGSMPGPDGTVIDFNRVYAEYIKPAIEAAGLVVFRADED